MRVVRVTQWCGRIGGEVVALTEIIERWMSKFDSDEALLDALAGFRVPATAVLSPAQLGDQEHLRARGAIREINDPLIGEMTIPGFPIHFSPEPDSLDLVAPSLGEHNQSILSELGLSQDEISTMVSDRVLMAKSNS